MLSIAGATSLQDSNTLGTHCFELRIHLDLAGRSFEGNGAGLPGGWLLG